MIQEITITHDHVLVTLSGSIYIAEAGQLRENLFNHILEGHSTIVINFSDVDYIDSSGLGAIVAIHKRAMQGGGSVIVKGLQGLVKELFELTRLNFVLEIQ